MAKNKQTILLLETAITLVPRFNGENPQDVYPFFSACDFVIKTVDEECRPILLQAILTKLAGKAFAITQHREVKSWDSLRELLTVTFCAKRTPGYLQLELSTTRFKSGETIQEYSSRVEKLLHELCNVSTSKRTITEAKAVHDYIKETTLTTYIEGLPDSIRNIIKSRNPSNLEDAMKVSLEEEKIFLSNKETQSPQTVKIPSLDDLSHETFEIVPIKFTQSKEVPKNANNRIQLLKENLRCNHMNNEEKESIERLCSEYSDIFFLEGDTLSCTETIQHEIKTSGKQTNQYFRDHIVSLILKKKKEIDKQIELEQDGIISPKVAHIQYNENSIAFIITKELCQQTTTFETFYKCIINLRIFCEENNITKIELPRVGNKLNKLNWEKVRAIIRYIFKNSKIKIIIYVDIEYSEEEKLKIIEEFHNVPLGGHQGVSRTIKRIKLHHQRKELKNYVKKFIASCQSCQQNKSMNRTIKQPMVITTTAKKPFEKIFIDIVGPLATTNEGHSYILTIQDDLTKFSAAFPLMTHDANSVAKTFVEKFICQHGIPESIVTDYGTEFMSKIFKECCKLLKIEKMNTTPYHPQSNGSLERSHRTLAEYLRHYVNKNQTDWDDYVAFATFVYNTTVYTTNYQPYELVYGFPATVPHTLSRTPQARYNYDDYTYELKQKLQETCKSARDNILKNKEKTKKKYDQEELQVNVKVGDQV
ncbi:hypothetical protein QTP88_018316 [Uroleucon formosanum]